MTHPNVPVLPASADRLAALLDRLDPAPDVCRDSECVHHVSAGRRRGAGV